MSVLAALPRRVASSYLPGAMPLMSRQSYRWEVRSSLFLPMAVACVEANVVAVIAKKVFGASNLSIALLAAAPAMSNISSVLWTRFIKGKDRVRAVNGMQAALLVCVGAIAAAPVNGWGEALVVTATLAARTLLTGIITARTDIWRNNYPRSQRARVTGKLLTVAAIVVGATGGALGVVMDAAYIQSQDAKVLAFRLIYAAAAALGLAGIWAFSNVRWRSRSAQIKAERDPASDYATAGARDMLRVLRDDKTYRSFMAAQFALGLPNLAGIPIFILALDAMLTRLHPGAQNYAQTILLTQIIPLIVPILTIPLWARLLDRTHIVRFRVFHSWTFVLANLLMGLGFWLDNLPVLYASRVMLGIAYGGGMLAWDLGHHDFARRDLATLYMGIHVTLTGVRGAVAPFLGTLLYSGSLAIPAMAAGGVPVLGDVRFSGASITMPALGAVGSFFLLAGGSVIGALMFLRLSRALGRRARTKPGDP